MNDSVDLKGGGGAITIHVVDCATVGIHNAAFKGDIGDHWFECTNCENLAICVNLRLLTLTQNV